tara:strand:+ start:3282 stop:4457 length:1176 start_codon:yes stop_codon:yes gene_type:complete
MNEMRISTQRILEEISNKFPGQVDFRRAIIEDVAKSMGFTAKDYYPLLKSDNRVKIGTYSLAGLLPEPAEIVPAATDKIPATAAQMQSIVSDERSYASVDTTFVPWGSFKDITQIIKSEMFYPTYVSGLSGNGKTFMIEQACAKLGKEFIRVQINPETDEDDLLGGFRLINGETVFAKGPVLKAMENGAVLLLDEIDRATNKIMCLQGILEGKPVLVKKTGETITPKKGFNVFATANTKGKGSDDGRFTAASIIDDAFLERFTISVDMAFPSMAIEKKILNKHMDKFDTKDDEFVNKLVTWADIIRKTFYDDGVDELVSTRRLCHIVQTFSIFNDKMKSIDLCISRFDDDTKVAFLDLYTKVDSGAQLDYGQPENEVDLEDLANEEYNDKI